VLSFRSGARADIAAPAASAAEVFGRLYEQYMPKVFTYISFRVSDRHTAEDLTSAVFEKALAKFDRYDAAKAAFSTWIFSIARNTVIDHYRSASRERNWVADGAEDMPARDGLPEEEASRAEEIEKLRSCMAQLGQTEKEIISLKFGSDLNNRQIAAMLGLSESNVGTIIYRAVRKLRDGFTGWQK